MPFAPNFAAALERVRDAVAAYDQQIAISIAENHHHVATSADLIHESRALLARVNRQFDGEPC